MHKETTRHSCRLPSHTPLALTARKPRATMACEFETGSSVRCPHCESHACVVRGDGCATPSNCSGGVFVRGPHPPNSRKEQIRRERFQQDACPRRQAMSMTIMSALFRRHRPLVTNASRTCVARTSALASSGYVSLRKVARSNTSSGWLCDPPRQAVRRYQPSGCCRDSNRARALEVAYCPPADPRPAFI